MTLRERFGRVYLHVDKDFFNSLESQPSSLLNLYETIAIECHDENGNPFIINGNITHIALQHYISRRCNQFIAEIEKFPADDIMSSMVSRNQIKKLLKAYKKKKGDLSAYSLIIIHIMNLILKENNPSSEIDIRDSISVIKRITDEYLEQYPQDELAIFLINCYKPLIDKLNTPGEILIKDFPPIPKIQRYFRDDN